MILGNGNKQNNNQDNKVNVNTRSKQFMNKDGFFPSTLVIGFWNDMISLKMHPALPREKQTQSSVFDYQQSIQTSLTLEKAMLLYNKIEEVIEPALKEGRVASVSVLIGFDGLVQVGTGIKGEIRPFIGIHKGLDANTKIATESCFYEFVNSGSDTLTAIEDYDHETGKYQASSISHAELLLFKELLIESVRGLLALAAHSDRHVNKFYRDKVLNDLAAIGGKMGLQLKKEFTSGGFGGNGFNNRQGNPFGGNTNNNNSGSSYEAPTTNLDNLSDIDSFLD